MNRKRAAEKIIDEMYEAIKIVGFNQPYDDAWERIKEDKFEATREALTKEFLFIGEKVERALKLFLDIMSETVFWDWEIDSGYSYADKDKMIRKSYQELEYLSDHIINFLRYQIYLIKDEPLILSKIALLKACRFINSDRFKDLKFPNQGIIKLDGSQSPMNIVKLSEDNLALFKREFTSFLSFLKTAPLKFRSEYFMNEIAETEKILPDL